MPKKLDITGQKFGNLTVLKLISECDKYGNKIWECACNCGNICHKKAGSLKSGSVKSCGCFKKYGLKDITGHKFGKLTALRPIEGKNKHGDIIWECVCDFGNTCLCTSGDLKKGSKSCGNCNYVQDRLAEARDRDYVEKTSLRAICSKNSVKTIPQV